MFCPSCGAPNDEPNQRYCQECGATLPAGQGRGTAMVHRPSGGGLPAYQPRRQPSGPLALLPQALHHKLAVGAVVAVVGVVALYVVLSAIVHALLALAPILVLLAACYVGFLYLKRTKFR